MLQNNLKDFVNKQWLQIKHSQTHYWKVFQLSNMWSFLVLRFRKKLDDGELLLNGSACTFYPISDNGQCQRNIGLFIIRQPLLETFKESAEFGLCCVVTFGPPITTWRFGEKLIHATDQTPATQPVSLPSVTTTRLCGRCLGLFMY
jgi:hypothetical protein